MFASIRQLVRDTYENAIPYEPFVALGEPQGHRPAWDQRYSQLELTADQENLIAAFKRPMPVLCLTGTWCGDCALQGSAMQRIAEASPGTIDLRFVMRSDEHAELVTKVQMNAGFRVPITFFMAEDFEPVSVIGDRTLSRYRSMARKALPEWDALLPAPPEDPVRKVLDEVLEEFERVQLVLRLSGRLRQKYGD